MIRSKQGIAGIFFAILVLFMVSYWGQYFHKPEGLSIATSAINKLIERPLDDLEGNQHSLSEWRGKILVVNFWAVWCPPCREEFPDLVDLSMKYSGTNVQFIGVAVDAVSNVRGFLRLNSLNYPQLVAKNAASELLPAIGNVDIALPYTIVLDANNVVLWRQLGRISKQDLDDLLQKLTVR